jgi:hypothetical protein
MRREIVDVITHTPPPPLRTRFKKHAAACVVRLNAAFRLTVGYSFKMFNLFDTVFEDVQ